MRATLFLVSLDVSLLLYFHLSFLCPLASRNRTNSSQTPRSCTPLAVCLGPAPQSSLLLALFVATFFLIRPCFPVASTSQCCFCWLAAVHPMYVAKALFKSSFTADYVQVITQRLFNNTERLVNLFIVTVPKHKPWE